MRVLDGAGLLDQEGVAFAPDCAMLALPRVRHALQTWRHHATTQAPTGEPMPQPPEGWYPEFAAWLERQMPANTVIGDPLWWASRIADWLIAKATLEAEPLPQAGAGISDEEWDALKQQLWNEHRCVDMSDVEYMPVLAFGEALDQARAVLARWGGAAVQAVPVSERPWERPGWCDADRLCWVFAGGWVRDYPQNFSHTVCLPHWALPVPAADKGEGKG
jgi:hypothetical protein